jgi:glycosyltransferase involved in cell wall biosynthesis
MRAAILVSAPVDPNTLKKAERGLLPRQDYAVLAEELDAQLVTPVHKGEKPAGWSRKMRLLAKVAWTGFSKRHEYDVIISDVDRVGLLLALLFKVSRTRKRHLVICHGKMAHRVDKHIVKYLGLHKYMDRFVCYGPEIARQISESIPVSDSQVVTLWHAADHRFWKPLEVEPRPKVVSAGLFQRDYPTLIEAVRDMGITLEIAGHSPWVPEKTRALTDGVIPDNVRLGSYDYASLRELYASALCVAVPLIEHDTQAGSLVVYEAMAMGKPVIVTRTRGQAAMGLIEDGQTGFYVEPGDIAGWQKALGFLHEHPDEALRIGQNARRAVENGLNLDAFVKQFAALVRNAPSHSANASAPAPQPR